MKIRYMIYMRRKESINNKRDSSIELLRIIAMIGVIILHYNNENMGGI